MSLFQKSVLNKYLTELDNKQIEKQYNQFKTYFLNATIQRNIIASKEEEFQEGFLRELFVKVLGYTINPEPDFNLRTELKNEKDSKKADGAIINKDFVLAVIELKSTTTTDLNKIEIQAFNYKNNQKDCRYIITSNFQKIRFYIDNAIDFIEWDLFKLDLDNFKFLYLCLAKENIFSNVAATIKKESITVEENITKQLYKEYSSFRKSLFNNIVELNPIIDKLLLFKKTQKMLDRFLFLFFSEDRMLVPPNSVRLILDQWNSLKDMDAYQSLYSRFKLYFGYLNTGHKGKLHEIFAYNGGLFAPDEILDIVHIDDATLYNATLGLSRYDYNSDVDVNILGHIFEHSLTEIEDLENEIANADKEVSKTTKRKKDGVFYTPKYITKYIVENTVGTLCKSKKEELNIVEEDYHSLTKKERKKLFENLQQYKEWLLHITIVDPACGSGAFLNQALDFLIAEHKFISELEANITGSSIVFDVENSILENNLFGVDINEESIEIAKLSLWLRTAKKGRKLNSLNNNIKCGNSLIDDVTVAGDKAFNWQKEYSNIFNCSQFNRLYFVTFVTHNSRVSERMVTYNDPNFIQNLQPFILNQKSRLTILNVIVDTCKKSNIHILAINILPDHVHLVIQAIDKEDLDKKVKKIKGASSYYLNRALGLEANTNKVWAQKYHWQIIEGEEMLGDIMNYINNNHYKHAETWGEKIIAEYDNGFKPIAEKATISLDDYFALKSGFDVVIGNPPYLRVQGLRESFEIESKFYETNYLSATGRFDIYVLFIEKSTLLINTKGLVSFILPHKFLISDFGEGIRKFLSFRKCVSSILHFGSEMVFSDASTYTCIINLSHHNKNILFTQIDPEQILENLKFNVINYDDLSELKWNLNSTEKNIILNKLYQQPNTIKTIFKNISQGIVTVGDDIFLLKGIIMGEKFVGYSEKLNKEIEVEAGIIKPLLKGEDVKKYCQLHSEYYCIYPHYNLNGKTLPYDENTFKVKFPLAYHYMLPFKDELIAKKIKYKTNPKAWYSLHRSRDIELFEQEKIITPEISLGTNMTLDFNNHYHNTKCYTLELNKEFKNNYRFWITLLNSKLMWYFLASTGYVLRGGFFTFKTKYLEPFPLPDLPKNSGDFELKAINMLSKNKELQQINIQFQKLLTSKFVNIKINNKLEKWYTLSFSDFSKELNKHQKTMGLNPLTLQQESVWLQFFEEQQQKALSIKNEIDATDKQIDKMVYELYGLTEEEINIVEAS